MLHLKVDIPDYEEYRQEIVTGFADSIELKRRFWDVPYALMFRQAPKFAKFLETKRRLPVRLCRFYYTPPYSGLGPHIDGYENERSPIGLNLPLIGCENTSMNWYDTPEDNLTSGNFGFGNFSACTLKDIDNVTLLDTIELSSPTFVRTDIVHSVDNLKETPRLILSIRFAFNNNSGKNFEDVYKL